MPGVSIRAIRVLFGVVLVLCGCCPLWAADGLYTVQADDGVALKMRRYRPSEEAPFREGSQPVVLFSGILTNMNEFLTHTPEERKAAYAGMTLPEPAFDLVAPGWPIYTRARNLPPARFIESEVRNCLVAEGADIRGARLSDSVVGVRSIVRPGCVLDRVVMLGADFYDGDTVVRVPSGRGPVPPLGIGRGSQLSQAIVDKNARIGENVVITPKKRGVDIDGPGWWVRDGITIVPKNAVIPDGTWI